MLGDAVGLGGVGFFEGCFFGLSLALPALLARAVTPVVAPASAVCVCSLCDFVWWGEADGAPGVSLPACAPLVVRRTPPVTRPATAAAPSAMATFRGEIGPICMPPVFP